MIFSRSDDVIVTYRCFWTLRTFPRNVLPTTFKGLLRFAIFFATNHFSYLSIVRKELFFKYITCRIQITSFPFSQQIRFGGNQQAQLIICTKKYDVEGKSNAFNFKIDNSQIRAAFRLKKTIVPILDKNFNEQDFFDMNLPEVGNI